MSAILCSFNIIYSYTCDLATRCVCSVAAANGFEFSVGAAGASGADNGVALGPPRPLQKALKKQVKAKPR